MRGDILGMERRRRWTAEDKLAIALSVGMDGATVTQVAQRHDITRQQIYAWRHALKKAGLLRPATGAVFLSLDMPTSSCAPVAHEAAPAAALPDDIPIELCLGHGRCLRFPGSIDGATLTRLIRAAEAA
jgi:transposase